MKGYLKFVEKEQLADRKTRRWTVTNLDDFILGWVEWKNSWRCYWFLPMGPSGFDATCLMDIVKFLDAQNRIQKCLDIVKFLDAQNRIQKCPSTEKV
jgi:hypothetical protein